MWITDDGRWRSLKESQTVYASFAEEGELDSNWMAATFFALSGMASAIMFSRPKWQLSLASQKTFALLQVLGLVGSFWSLYLFISSAGVLKGLGYFSLIAFASAFALSALARSFDGFVSIAGISFFIAAGIVLYQSRQDSLAMQEEAELRVMLARLQRLNENSVRTSSISAPRTTQTIVHSPPEPTGLNALRARMPAERARTYLLNDGWQFVRASRHDILDRCGSRRAVCQQFVEAQECAGSGLGQCRFEYFHADKGKLIAITVGDDPVLDSWWIQKGSP